MKNDKIGTVDVRSFDNTKTSNFLFFDKKNRNDTSFSIQNNALSKPMQSISSLSQSQCFSRNSSIIKEINDLISPLKNMEDKLNLQRNYYDSCVNRNKVPDVIRKHSNDLITSLTNYILKLKHIISQTPRLLTTISSLIAGCPDLNTQKLEELKTKLNALPTILTHAEEYSAQLKCDDKSATSNQSLPRKTNQPLNLDFFIKIGELLILIKQISDGLGKLSPM